jgi:hypothetical protein
MQGIIIIPIQTSAAHASKCWMNLFLITSKCQTTWLAQMEPNDEHSDNYVAAGSILRQANGNDPVEQQQIILGGFLA